MSSAAEFTVSPWTLGSTLTAIPRKVQKQGKRNNTAMKWVIEAISKFAGGAQP